MPNSSAFVPDRPPTGVLLQRQHICPRIVSAQTSHMTAKRKRGRTGGTRRGRPTRFRPEFIDIAAAMAKNGATDADIAHALGVSTKTISRWQSQHEEFCRALIVPPGAPDDRAERGLFQRAVGYEYDEAHPIKLKEVKYEDGKKVSETERIEIVEVSRVLPPDPAAGMRWLTNKRPDRWGYRQTHEVTGKDGKDLIPTDASPREVARAVADLLREAAHTRPTRDEEEEDADAPRADDDAGAEEHYGEDAAPASSDQGHLAPKAVEAPRVRRFNPVTGRLE